MLHFFLELTKSCFSTSHLELNYNISYPLYTSLLSDSYWIDALAIRRPWVTFVNAFTDSMLGRFFTARNSTICFVRLAYGIVKARE